MALEFDVRSDFATILDGGEPVTLARRDGSEVVAIPQAWRYSSRIEPAEPGVADVPRHDVEWQFPWNDEEEPPELGDRIVDEDENEWTILSIVEHGAKSRLRCLSRNLAIVSGLDNLVEILLAEWDEGSEGPMIVGWSSYEAGVPARIQPDRVMVDNDAEPPTSAATYRVILDIEMPLDHNYRIVGPDSTVYQILEFTQAKRIDVLPVAKVVRVPDA